MPSHSARALFVAVVVLLAGCTGSAGVNQLYDSSAPVSPTAEPTGPQNGTLEVHFINVGQSVSTLIIGPTNETMLVDSGHFTDDGDYVLQYLQAHNISRIDYLVTSHNDADHIGGNAAVIEYYETEADGIGAIYDPGIAASTNTFAEYLDAVEAYNVTLYRTLEGDSIPLENVTVEVMGPPDPYIENEARNENSIVLKLTYGETSFLLTGDAEDDQEAYLVETYGAGLNATVMKAGHHGSASSTSGAILDAAQPKAVIVSSAYDSQYGHPSEATLERLADRNISTYWTATHGHVVLLSDGQNVSVRTQRAAPTAPLSIRDADPIEPGVMDEPETRATITGGGVLTTTPTETPVVTDGGTATPEPGTLVLADVNANPAGRDRENLNDETVTFENAGGEPIDMSGWTISDPAGHDYTMAEGFVLEPGATVTLHTGIGTDSATDLYWNRRASVWNNDGDIIIVTNREGTEILREDY